MDCCQDGQDMARDHCTVDKIYPITQYHLIGSLFHVCAPFCKAIQMSGCCDVLKIGGWVSSGGAKSARLGNQQTDGTSRVETITTCHP